MRAATWLLVPVLALTVAGCSSSDSTASKSGKTMPDVTGTKLDVAEDAIQKAGGDPDDIKIVGGGALGVVVRSNWTVCSQSPAPGQSLSSPRLTIERSCSSGSTASGTTSASAPVSSAAASGTPQAAKTLTVANSKDLAALFKVGDGCDPPVAAFATKYAGASIEFDGSVSASSPSSSGTYDILLAPGDDGPDSAAGPNLQFQDVGDPDLNPAGADALELGTKVHVVAGVAGYSGDKSCLLQLTPISTKVR